MAVFLILLLFKTENFILAVNSSETVIESRNYLSEHQPRNLPPVSDLLWPNKTIPYKIDSNFTEVEVKVILEADFWWQRNTCVRWVKKNSNYKVFVNITRGDKCRSAVGRRKVVQNLELSPIACNITKINVLHEMMHAAGFIHEHQRPDRDKYVTIYWENIKQEGRSNFVKIDKRYFDKGYNFQYDIQSVMHYTETMFLNKSLTGLKTIEAKNKKSLRCKQNAQPCPTELDIMKINTIYGCPSNKN